jgi:hypothetical protein
MTARRDHHPLIGTIVVIAVFATGLSGCGRSHSVPAVTALRTSSDSWHESRLFLVRPSGCPAHVIDRPVSLDVVARHVRQLLPMTHSNYGPSLVIAAWWLAGVGPESPGVLHYRYLVRRRCGWSVAANSWAVRVIFPHMHLPSADWVFFVVRTSAGWELFGEINNHA